MSRYGGAAKGRGCHSRMLSGTQVLSTFLLLTSFLTWSIFYTHSRSSVSLTFRGVGERKTKGKKRLSLGKAWPFYFESTDSQELLPPSQWPGCAKWTLPAMMMTEKRSMCSQPCWPHIMLRLRKI